MTDQIPQPRGNFYASTGELSLPQATYTYNNGLVNPVPAPDENKARHIEIDQLNGGYNIRVGCHQFAFETHAKMLKHLAAYLANPKEVEEKWFKKKLDLTK